MSNAENFYDELDRAPDLAKVTMYLAQQQILERSNQIEQIYREKYMIDKALAGYKMSFFSYFSFVAVLVVSTWFFEFDYQGNVAGFVLLFGAAASTVGWVFLTLMLELKLRLLREKIIIAERVPHYPSVIDEGACNKVDLDTLRDIRRRIA